MRDEAIALYARFRDLAVQKPRQAREMVCELLDSDSPLVTEILDMMSAPNDGRLRQLIANAVRPRDDKSKVVQVFIRWLETETDEFARTALKVALQGVNLKAFQSAPASDLPELVDTYRYVSERLCHRIRNSLVAPHAEVRNLRDLLKLLPEDTTRREFDSAIGRVQNSLKRVSYISGFDDNEEMFEMRPIAICPWLEQMTKKYSQEWHTINLCFEGHASLIECRVVACEYWLDTAFWNLWKNAEQATDGDNCNITVHLSTSGGYLRMLLLDSGDGFSTDAQSVAFEVRFSTKGYSHGRGLLEVQDAVQRLAGKVELIHVHSNGLRVQLKLPLELK